MSRRFPSLDADAIVQTRDALHAYSRVLGNCIKQVRAERKHWWHISLRPSLTGLTTGVVRGDVDFELAIDMRNSRLMMQTAAGDSHSEALTGQRQAQLIDVVAEFLTANGVVGIELEATSDDAFDAYSAEQAGLIGRAVSAVAAAMADLRAGIREETSPIQVWPHHFDLSMLWLPGDKVHGQDADNAEYSDKQMNFGFVLGDGGIPEPYFYVTAYPLPGGFPTDRLPEGTTWQSEGFTGAVLLYRRLVAEPDPAGYLLDLWNELLARGRKHLVEST